MMAGRDLLPGEYEGGYLDTRDGVRYLSRITRGQLTTPSNTTGRVQVNSLELLSVRDATVPVLWMSNQGRQSAWGRYMPFGGEQVHVAYRNDNTAVIIGYDANRSGEKDPVEGWPFLKTLYDEQVVGYASFKDLNPGEFDFKSGGDAYILGTNQGTLFLAGGQAFIKLDKQNYKIESKSAAYLYQSETTTYRLGTVYRKETVVSDKETPISNGSLKEFLVDLNIPTAGVASPQSVAKLHMGNIVDELTLLEENSSYGAPKRFKLSIGDSLNLNEVFNLTIDNGGNVDIIQTLPTSSDIHVGWQIGDTTITINGGDGEFFIGQLGVNPVSVAIADYLEILWGQFKQIFDTHIHPTGVGPSGTPTSPMPSWDSNINSNKLIIPDN